MSGGHFNKSARKSGGNRTVRFYIPQPEKMDRFLCPICKNINTTKQEAINHIKAMHTLKELEVVIKELPR